MVGWSAFEKALDKVGGHTNLVGKYWITTFNMFRRILNAINLHLCSSVLEAKINYFYE